MNKRNLRITKPGYSEQILPVPWLFVVSRFHCAGFIHSVYDNKVFTACIYVIAAQFKVGSLPCTEMCPAGKWGLNCSQSCSCDHGGCNPVSGNCTCDRGWKGQRCDQVCSNCGQPCPPCFHGNGSCDQVSGKCLCFPGYQGSSCLEACSVGYCGDKCQQKCDCANGETCHHVTGQCLCKLGWTGARCNEGNYNC